MNLKYFFLGALKDFLCRCFFRVESRNPFGHHKFRGHMSQVGDVKSNFWHATRPSWYNRDQPLRPGNSERQPWTWSLNMINIATLQNGGIYAKWVWIISPVPTKDVGLKRREKIPRIPPWNPLKKSELWISSRWFRISQRPWIKPMFIWPLNYISQSVMLTYIVDLLSTWGEDKTS